MIESFWSAAPIPVAKEVEERKTPAITYPADHVQVGRLYYVRHGFDTIVVGKCIYNAQTSLVMDVGVRNGRNDVRLSEIMPWNIIGPVEAEPDERPPVLRL